MLGVDNLNKLLRNNYQRLHTKSKQATHLGYADFLGQDGFSWLFPYLHQVHHMYESVAEVDGYCFGAIKQLIFKKQLYITLVEIPEFAQPNSDIECMLDYFDTELFDIQLSNTPQKSDGFLTLKRDTTVAELIPDDSKIEGFVPELRRLRKGLQIPLEIGTNPISKVWQYLESNIGCVARIPYDFEMDEDEMKIPYMMILCNKSITFPD